MLNMVCIDIIRKHFLYCLTSAKEAMQCHHECLYNPHSIIQSNNNICSVLSNCFGIISHFCLFSKSKFVYNSYYLHFFFIQVRISALMYRSSSGISKKKNKKKKPHFLRFVYTTTTFLLWMKLNINKKGYWYSVIKMKYVSFYIFFLVSNFLIFISCYPYNTVAINVCFCLKSVTINLNWFDFYLCLF